MCESDRNKLNLMSPGKWEELKAEIKNACALFESLSPVKLRIHESGDEFIVERVEGDWVPKHLRLEYNSLIPCVSWRCCDPNEQRGIIDFRVFNGSIFYVVGVRVTPLPEIVTVLTSCVTGAV